MNAAVKRLRDVLGDSADTPRFVETVPKRGYRFVASVQGIAAAPTDGASVGLAPVVAPAPAPDTSSSPLAGIGAGPLLAGLGGLGGWWWHGAAARAATSPRPAAPSPPHLGPPHNAGRICRRGQLFPRRQRGDIHVVERNENRRHLRNIRRIRNGASRDDRPINDHTATYPLPGLPTAATSRSSVTSTTSGEALST